MKVISPAGEFHVTLKSMETKDKEVMLKWQMGVWEARAFLEKRDMTWIIKTILSRPSLLWFIIKTLFKKEVKRSSDQSSKGI